MFHRFDSGGVWDHTGLASEFMNYYCRVKGLKFLWTEAARCSYGVEWIIEGWLRERDRESAVYSNYIHCPVIT